MATRRDWPILLALAAVTVAVFWPVSRHEFVNYDDPAYVTANSMVQQGLTWRGVAWAFGHLHGEATYWHPVTWLSHMLDCQLFGLRPAGHHLGNLFFHTLNVMLLFLLLRWTTGRWGPSAVVAALFALHPLQVDTVAWIAERKNGLSTSFWLLTLLAYVRYTACPSSLRYLVVVLLMALGLMVKPILVTLPCVLLLLDYWPLRRFRFSAADPASVAPSTTPPEPQLPPARSGSSVGRLLLEKAPLLALSVLSSLITIRGHVGLGALMSAEEFPLTSRLANAAVTYALYLRKVIWPADLSVFYLHPGHRPASAVLGSALLLAGLTVGALMQVRRRPYLAVGWLWFLGTLVPTIGLVQAHVQAMADRFAYVPVIGLFVMAVWAAAEWGVRWRERRNLLVGLTALVLASCAVMSLLQLRHWRDSLTLLLRAVQVEPGNYLARIMLGNAYVERGRLDEALSQFQAATLLRPDQAETWLRAGATLAQMGRFTDAIPNLGEAIRLAPAWPEPRRRRALALLRQGHRAEARAAYLELVPLMPRSAEGNRDLADMLGEGQQFAEAIRYYHEALRLKPDFEGVLINLALLRATCEQPEFRDGPEAVQLAERACQVTQRRDPNAVGTLAVAYARAGRFPEAINTLQQAQALARVSGADYLLPLQTQLLDLFRAGKAFP